MIAGVDPGVDLADQETAAAAGGVPPAPRNSPPPRCQPDPQAPQAREPRGDRSAGIRSAPEWGASSAWAESAEKSETQRIVSKKRLKKPAPPTATTPSLYERVGGINNIAVLLDDVIERSYASEVFRANPQIEEAHKRFPRAVYKYNATSLACMVMGGPQKYTGRSVKEAHKDLQVTEKEWQELIGIFRESMNSFNVAPKEQGEIIAILEGAKGDVVVSPVKSAASK